MDRVWPGVFVAVVVLAALWTAGCVEPRTGADEVPTEGAGGLPEVPWGLSECRYVVSWGWVEGDRLAPYLPEGFTVRPGGSPLPAGAGGDVLFGVDVMECASGRTMEGEASPMDYGYVWAAADPPDGFLQEDIDPAEHYVKWDVLVPDTARRGTLESRGVPVRDGSATLEQGQLGPEGTLELAGIGTVRVQGIDTGEWDPFEGTFVKFTAAGEGAAAWRANATSGPRANGQAVLTYPEGSWMADVVGGTVLKGEYHTGTWSYEDARVLFLTVD